MDNGRRIDGEIKYAVTKKILIIGKVICFVLGFLLLTLFFICFVLPGIKLVTIKKITSRKAKLFFSIMFLSLIFCVYISPKYTMARIAGTIAYKAMLGNETDTRFIMKSQDCQYLKTKYDYAKHYINEHDDRCVLKNTHVLNFVGEQIQTLMMSPLSETHCIKIIINRKDNAIIDLVPISRKVIEKVLPNVKYHNEREQSQIINKNL